MPKEAFSYVSVIDAGSSGCRCHVYRYGKLGSVDGKLFFELSLRLHFDIRCLLYRVVVFITLISTLTLYRFMHIKHKIGPLYILPIHVSKKVKPGLSSFADRPFEAGASLTDLVAFLKVCFVSYSAYLLS